MRDYKVEVAALQETIWNADAVVEGDRGEEIINFQSQLAHALYLGSKVVGTLPPLSRYIKRFEKLNFQNDAMESRAHEKDLDYYSATAIALPLS